tara:strand:- start:391 stop:966 length:576 start_codon:yes stop_codon:yes gene_type:complete
MLILLCGYKRCGKDTVASYLSNKYDFHHLKISYLLKKTLKLLFNFSEEQLEGDLKEVIDEHWKITPRDTMKFVGTNLFQFNIQQLVPGICRNFWIKGLCEKINADYNDNKKNIVISDLRFIHELDYLSNNINSHEIVIVKIVRDGLIIQENITDISENEHLKFKFNNIIVNDNNMTNFEKTIDDLFESLIK